MKKPVKVTTEQEAAIVADTMANGAAPDMSDAVAPDTCSPIDRLAILESAFEATTDGLLVIGRDNDVIIANTCFREIFGIEDPVDGSHPTASSMTRAVARMVVDRDRFTELMQFSVDFPENPSIDNILLKDGRFIERYCFPNVVGGETVGCVMSFRDITAEKLTDDTLRESETCYRQLFDHNPYPIWVYDVESMQFLAVNEEAIKKYGYSRQEFLRLTLKDIRPPEDVPLLMRSLKASETSEGFVGCVRHQAKNGTIFDVEVAAQNIVYGGRKARMVMVTDLSARKKAESALRESESRIRTLLDSMSEGLLQVDLEDRILYTNNRVCEMTGYSQQELIGSEWSRLMVDNGSDFIEEIKDRRSKGISDRYEIRIRKKSGDVIWVVIGGAPLMDSEGNLIGSMGVLTDITERKHAEERLMHDALHDGLTGLANRTLFMDHLRATIERGRRNKKPFAVLYLDFDRFKVINDSLGHAEGDKLLKFIARRLENCIRTGDIVARLGGDEFVILLHELADTAEALLVAERIQSDLKLSFDLGGREIFTSTSIGIALSTSGHSRAEDMLRDADIAMYYAKAKGKAQYQIFDESMLHKASKKLQIETEMRLALAHNDFRMFYQPIVSLSTGALFGFESLLRWEHRERGLIAPDEFIPIAEETGMILKLGAWAIEQSCRQLQVWQQTEPKAEGLTISVNLSSKEFLQLDLVEKIASTLKATKLDPRFLKIEITESHIMENSELAVKIINQLRGLGIEMSLDDFGTGYSSLSYLHRLPVTFLKIDRSFVTRMTESGENREIVLTIVRLAQNLKMNVIAEGIETMEQFTELSDMGCDYGQGYLFSPPLDAEGARQFIAEKGVSKSIAPAIQSPEHSKLVM